MIFARGLPVLKRALSFLVPRNQAGKLASGQLIARYLPEVGYAGLSAGMAPEGTPMSTRLALAGEDLAIGLGSSLLGQGVGYGIGKRVVPGIRGKARAAMTSDQMGQLENIMTYGDIAAGPLNIVSPRPVSNAYYKKLNQDAQEQQDQQIAQQMNEREQALIQALLGGGAIAGSAAGLRMPLPLSALNI